MRVGRKELVKGKGGSWRNKKGEKERRESLEAATFIVVIGI